MTTNNSEQKQQSLHHVSADRELKPKRLIQNTASIPFSGLDTPAAYPDEISKKKAEASNRFNTKTPDSFLEATYALPEAYKVQTFASNLFVDVDDSGNKSYDLESLKGVDIDFSKMEEEEDATVEELVQDADANAVHEVPSRKTVVDKRRQALLTTGHSIKAEWQVASNRYTPLNVRDFFGKKAHICKQRGMLDMFGWVRFRDYGGEATITTIYPSEKHEVEPADENDTTNKEAYSRDDKERLTTAEDEGDEDEPKVAFFGDQVRYNFKSKAKMEIKPIVYFPDENVMIPLNMTGKPLVRKQMGSLMDDIKGHHKEVLDRIEEFAQEIDEEIMQARQLVVDFTECEFSMAEFFDLLGLDTDKYIESTVDRVKDFADHPQKPSVWNLQLGLKRTLIEEYDGNKASDRYANFQAIAGKLLQYPETQLRVAVLEYHRNNDETDDATTDEEQFNLDEFDVSEFDGISEGDVPTTQAENIQDAIESRLE